MAKYKNIKTGEVFDNAKEGSDYVCNGCICDKEKCPLYEYTHKHNTVCTDELAEEAFSVLYEECGFELIEGPKSTSRLAEVLGVEEDQEWTVRDDEEKVLRIHNGVRQWRLENEDSWRNCGAEAKLTELINNPSLIQSIPFTPKWTEREIEIAKAWKVLNPYMSQFTVNAINHEEIEIDGIPLTEDPEKCPNFFSFENKEIKVSDILGDSDV